MLRLRYKGATSRWNARMKSGKPAMKAVTWHRSAQSASTHTAGKSVVIVVVLSSAADSMGKRGATVLARSHGLELLETKGLIC